MQFWCSGLDRCLNVSLPGKLQFLRWLASVFLRSFVLEHGEFHEQIQKENTNILRFCRHNRLWKFQCLRAICTQKLSASSRHCRISRPFLHEIIWRCLMSSGCSHTAKLTLLQHPKYSKSWGPLRAAFPAHPLENAQTSRRFFQEAYVQAIEHAEDADHPRACLALSGMALGDMAWSCCKHITTSIPGGVWWISGGARHPSWYLRKPHATAHIIRCLYHRHWHHY